MKRKTCICTITFVIAGLLISSVSGTFAQMNVEKEQLENKNIGEALSEEIMILSCDELEEISIGQQTASKNVFDRMSLSTPSQSMDAQTGSLLLKTEGQRDVTILALHPALANDGMGHLVLGYYYYYYDPDTGFEEGPGVIWQGSNDNGDSWSPIPISLWLNHDYPSVHFKGFESGSGDPWFCGTAVDGSGFNIPLLHVIGDPTNSTSYSYQSWDWSSYGLYGISMSEIATAHYPGEEWAWGFISFVGSTTYGEDVVNGPFIMFPIDPSGVATLSWYLDIEGCLSTDAIIDPQANWYVDETYGYVNYAGYTVYDPIDYDTFTHTLAIRGFDWEKISILDDPDAHDVIHVWEGNSNYSLEYPAVDAYDNNLIVLAEVVNTSDPADTGIAIWHTDDGDPANLELTAYLSGSSVVSPEISHVDGEKFIVHVTIDGTLYLLITYDGGETWEGSYQWSDEGVVLEEYRNCDIADGGTITVYEGGNLLLDFIYNTFCQFNGHAFYEYGDPAPLESVIITNLNTGRSYEASVDYNYYWENLIIGLEVSDGDTLELVATDGFLYDTVIYNYTDDIVVTIDFYLGEPSPPPSLEVEITDGFGMTTFLCQESYPTTFIVRVLDGNGDPVAGIPSTDFDFIAYLGPDVGTCCDLNSHLIWTALSPTTDLNGEISWTVKSLTSISANIPAPTWSGGYITIEADHDDYESDTAVVYVNSPDINHDCWVNLMDFSTFAVDFGLNVQRSDYNWNGRSDLSDFSIFAVHFGHRQTCP